MSETLCLAAVLVLAIPALGLGGFENGGASQLQDAIDRIN